MTEKQIPEVSLFTLAQLTTYRAPLLSEVSSRLQNYSPQVPLEMRGIVDDYSKRASDLYAVAAKSLSELSPQTSRVEDFDTLIPSTNSSVDNLIEFTHNFSKYLLSSPDAYKPQVNRAAKALMSAKQELSSLSDIVQKYAR
jgi:predicted component of viral defense system (DUF524 family)